MAKRKAGKAKGRKAAASRRSSTSRSTGRRHAARKGAARTRATGRATKKKAARKTARAGTRKASPRKTSTRKASPRKATARKLARKATARKGQARKAVARKAVPVRRKAEATAEIPLRKAPSLNRERRTVQDDDLVPTPPSSLDLDRSASAARSGRRELHERYAEHTETSPAITGGDVDADWESAYSVGDEAPGGDSPTPDQDIVDDIGRAVGLEYQDNEELKGERKISDRDKHRWELDPASAEDYDDRD